MQFIFDNWMLIFVALASGLMLFLPVIQGSFAAGVTVIQAVQKINREKALIIDVCTEQEYDAGHLPGARHIPLGELQTRLPQIAQDKNQPLIMVCATGARARSAAAAAKQLGYTQAMSLMGGLKSWREANQPLVKA